MTSFEEMGFREINNMARYDGFTCKEAERIEELGIIESKKSEHICFSCERRYDCYLEEWFIGGDDGYIITDCKYWEEKP